MEHLYDEEIEDKDVLNAKCMDIYVSQIEKAADKDSQKESEIFLVMHKGSTGDWQIDLDDQTMANILGNLKLPETGDK